MNLRRATSDDAEACGVVQYTSWVQTYTGLADDEFWERMSAERCVAAWVGWLAAGLDATLAEVDGRVVGFAFARESRENAVLPPGTPAQLWVADHNPRATRFYERNGFRADGATDDGEGFGGIAAIRMVR